MEEKRRGKGKKRKDKRKRVSEVRKEKRVMKRREMEKREGEQRTGEGSVVPLGALAGSDQVCWSQQLYGHTLAQISQVLAASWLQDDWHHVQRHWRPHQPHRDQG